MLNASGQALAYVYARGAKQQADIAKVLTFDEARRIAVVTRRHHFGPQGSEGEAQPSHNLGAGNQVGGEEFCGRTAFLAVCL